MGLPDRIEKQWKRKFGLFRRNLVSWCRTLRGQKQIHTMLRCIRTDQLKECQSATSNDQLFYFFIDEEEASQFSKLLQ